MSQAPPTAAAVALPPPRRTYQLSSDAVVLSLRFVLTLVMGALLLFGEELRYPGIQATLFLAYILGHSAFFLIRQGKTVGGRLQGFLFMTDVAFVSLVSTLAGDWDNDLLLVYFLIIFMASLQQSLKGTLLVALVATALYLSRLSLPEGQAWYMDSRVLLRLPFFYIISLFAGFMATQSRRSDLRLNEERGRAEKLRISAIHATRQLAQAQAKVWQQSSEDVLKTAFMESSSHEIRNALATVKGNCALLERNPDALSGEEKARLFSALHRNATRLEWQVEQVVSYLDLERGEFEVYREKTDLEKALKGCLPWMAGISGNHDFDYKVDTELPWMECDVLRLELALWNLVNNAVKFSPLGGRIQVRAKSQGHAVAIEVRDEGMGIAPEDLGRIFQKYGRGSSQALKGIVGAGLGLYVARMVAELHGGSLKVESELGAGSTFTLILPIQGPD